MLVCLTTHNDLHLLLLGRDHSLPGLRCLRLVILRLLLHFSHSRIRLIRSGNSGRSRDNWGGHRRGVGNRSGCCRGLDYERARLEILKHFLLKPYMTLLHNIGGLVCSRDRGGFVFLVHIDVRSGSQLLVTVLWGCLVPDKVSADGPVIELIELVGAERLATVDRTVCQQPAK